MSEAIRIAACHPIYLLNEIVVHMSKKLTGGLSEAWTRGMKN